MNSLWDTASQLRATVMRDGLDIRSARGLEIGPLAHPIVGKDEGEVIYVDHTDAASLRQTYENSEFADRIVEVDAIWGEQTLLSCIGGQRVDYIVASHVAEHVPDLITWLNEAGKALLPGGELRLALPDLRFSNDVLRPPTRVSDLLTAWLLQARRPQLRDVLDFRLHETIGVDGAGFYDGRASRGDVRPFRSIGLAVDCGRMALAQPESYFDVHCLAASALQFATLMEQLAGAGLMQMACARMIDTAPPLYEFYAFLTPSDDPEAVTRSWAAARLACNDPLPGSVEATEQAARVSQIAEMTERLAAAAATAAELEGLLAAQAAEIAAQAAAAAQAALELAEAKGRFAGLDTYVAALQNSVVSQAAAIAVRDVEAERTAVALAETGRKLTGLELYMAALQSSTSWRVTAPLRSLKRLFGPRGS